MLELQERLLKLRKAVDEDLPEGMSIVDDPDQEFGSSEAEKWLAAQEAKSDDERSDDASQWHAAQEKRSGVKRQSSTPWTPGELTDKQKEIVDKAMKEGHTEKEAHWLAGEKVHGYKPEHHSSKVLDILKDAAKKHMDNEAYNSRIEASESMNPAKYAEGRRIDAFAHHTGDYKNAYNEKLQDEALKGMSPKERHAHLREWKQGKKGDYHKDIRDTESAEQATGAAQRKVSPLQGEHKKWFDYTVQEHLPEIEKNINYLRAKGQVPPNIEHGDLVAHGVNGLMDALSRYDEDVARRTHKEGSNPFTKYASQRMRGKILDHVKRERGPQGDVGSSGMSTAEAAQHLGLTGEGEEMPGISITGGSSKAHQHLDDSQRQRMQAVKAAKAASTPQPQTIVRRKKGTE